MLHLILYYFQKCKKKHNINIAFHNIKIKCTQNQTSVVSVILQFVIATLSYKIMITKYLHIHACLLK